MNRNEIAIATITLARDKEEEQLLCGSLQRLSALGLPVYITDGGSPASFISFLHSMPNFKVSPDTVKGVWQQAVNSLKAAWEAQPTFILYTEPDKLDFFSHALPHLLSNITNYENSGIVLASRSKNSFASFPYFQQMTETTINRCCTELMGKEVDYTYGPFLLKRELVPYLELLKEDTGWGWRPFLFNIAARLDYRLDTYEVEVMCPPDQQTDTQLERIYRMRQLEQNIRGLVLSARTVL